VIIAASIASLLYGVPHLVYHIAHADSLATSDAVISLFGLALFATIPVALIALSRRVSAETQH
jgi:hypothetical protein